MKWSAFFKMQKELDDYIEKNHNLESKNLFKEKCLALLVELGELANETRCFKFWSVKPASSKDLITEEYVDGIHFILSLGLEQAYYYETQPIEHTENTQTEQFLKVFTTISIFMDSPSQDNYTNLFKSYLQLGELLNITEEELQEAYSMKNNKNYKRQDENY